MDKDTPIAYWKGNTKDFMEPEAVHKWYALIPDPVRKKIKDHNTCGMIQLKLFFNNVTRNGPVDIKKIRAFSKPIAKRMVSYALRCYIY